MHCTPTTAIQSDKPSTKHKDGISEKSWNHPKITRSHIHWVASPSLLYLLSRADTFKSLDGHSGACTNHSNIPAEVTRCYLELHLQSFFSWTPLKTNLQFVREMESSLLPSLFWKKSGPLFKVVIVASFYLNTYSVSDAVVFYKHNCWGWAEWARHTDRSW